MPIIKSAKKRVLVSTKATVRNAKSKRTIRESVKEFYKAIASGKQADITTTHQKAVSAIDTAAKKNVIHKNKAARKKSQLHSAAKTAGKNVASTVKKPAALSSAPKASPVKKAITGKEPATAKKPTTKTSQK